MKSTQLQVHPKDPIITIRPIRLADAAMEAEFVRKLSPETKHYRFLGGLKELSPALLKSLCDIDYRHSMAFVATVTQDGKEIEIGVSRYAPNANEDVRERFPAEEVDLYLLSLLAMDPETWGELADLL